MTIDELGFPGFRGLWSFHRRGRRRYISGEPFVGVGDGADMVSLSNVA